MAAGTAGEEREGERVKNYPMGDLRIGRTLDLAGQFLSDHLRDLLRINLYIFIPTYFIAYVAMGYLSDEATLQGAMQKLLYKLESPETGTPTGSDIAMKLIAAVIALLYAGANVFFITPITAAAVLYFSASRYLGKTPTPRECLSRAFKKYGQFLLAGVLYWLISVAVLVVGGFLVALGTAGGAAIAGPVGGIIMTVLGLLTLLAYLYASVRYVLVFPVVMVEDIHDAAALRRSSFLTRDRIWRGIWLMVLANWIIGALVMAGVAAIPVVWLSTAIGTVGVAITQTFSLVALMVYYFNCRCVHENFDIAYLARQSFAEAQPDAFASNATGGTSYSESEAALLGGNTIAAAAGATITAMAEDAPALTNAAELELESAEPGVAAASAAGLIVDGNASPVVAADSDAPVEPADSADPAAQEGRTHG